MNHFGGAVDSAEDAGLMIVGDEFSEIDGYVMTSRSFLLPLMRYCSVRSEEAANTRLAAPTSLCAVNERDTMSCP